MIFSSFFFSFSFLRYNEKLHDLLPAATDVEHEIHTPVLRLVEHPDSGVTVRGLSQHVVTSFEEVQRLLEDGSRIRTMAATAKNATSSRSHVICQLFLTRKCRNTDNGDVEVRRSKINVIDLAGSECANVHTDEYARSKANV